MGKGSGQAETACHSCEWRLYKASGLLRCLERRDVARCSNYCGPYQEYHFELAYGKGYANGLSRERGAKR